MWPKYMLANRQYYCNTASDCITRHVSNSKRANRNKMTLRAVTIKVTRKQAM